MGTSGGSGSTTGGGGYPTLQEQAAAFAFGTRADSGFVSLDIQKAVEADADQGVEPAVVLPQATAVVSLPTFILSTSQRITIPKKKNKYHRELVGRVRQRHGRTRANRNCANFARCTRDSGPV